MVGVAPQQPVSAAPAPVYGQFCRDGATDPQCVDQRQGGVVHVRRRTVADEHRCGDEYVRALRMASELLHGGFQRQPIPRHRSVGGAPRPRCGRPLRHAPVRQLHHRLRSGPLTRHHCVGHRRSHLVLPRSRAHDGRQHRSGGGQRRHVQRVHRDRPGRLEVAAGIRVDPVRPGQAVVAARRDLPAARWWIASSDRRRDLLHARHRSPQRLSGRRPRCPAVASIHRCASGSHCGASTSGDCPELLHVVLRAARAVRLLQRSAAIMNARIYLRGGADGVYGSATRDAQFGSFRPPVGLPVIGRRRSERPPPRSASVPRLRAAGRRSRSSPRRPDAGRPFVRASAARRWLSMQRAIIEQWDLPARWCRRHLRSLQRSWRSGSTSRQRACR